jgi:hypothetical protein
MRKWLWLTLAILLGGCSLGVQMQLDRFDTTANAYERAIRWSDFTAAYAIASDPKTAPIPDFAKLKGIEVTSYESRGSVPDATATHIVQLVEIRYVHTDRMAERVIMDKQVWEYSDAEGRWFLKSPFPQFK